MKVGAPAGEPAERSKKVQKRSKIGFKNVAKLILFGARSGSEEEVRPRSDFGRLGGRFGVHFGVHFGRRSGTENGHSKAEIRASEVGMEGGSAAWAGGL